MFVFIPVKPIAAAMICLSGCIALSAQTPEQSRQTPPGGNIQKRKAQIEAALQAAGTDTARVRLRLQLAGIVSQENPADGIALAREAAALAEKTGHTETIARSYFGVGNLYLRDNRQDQALEWLNKGLPLATKTGKPDLQEACYKSLAHIYFNQGVYEKSLEYYREALALLEKMQAMPVRKAVALIQIGHLLSRTGKTREAIESYQKALGNLEQAQDWGKMGHTWRSIGDNYRILGETERTEQAYAKSQEYLERDKKKASSPASRRSANN
ncbi:MAG: tetratricopeptide repeat protein [Saprospirales bacterium]|nr:tetratricopeptide repeat protein [Saprospirales bacterium]